MDDVNAAVAELQCPLRDDGRAPDHHLQPEGNYPLHVLGDTPRLYGEVELLRTTKSVEVQPGISFLGIGHHLQAASGGGPQP
jgi:hypothetical protein